MKKITAKATRWCCLHENETLKSLTDDITNYFIYEDKNIALGFMKKGRHIVRITLEIVE